MSILYFLIALLVLAVMITVHELGHYTAGRLLGFKIIDFSVGFGPALIKHKSKKTGIVYALRSIPLGGACRFYGEEDDPKDIADADNAVPFNSQKPWKRLLVIFAGPFMNFVLAYVLAFIMMLCFGEQQIVSYDNGHYAITINEVTEGSPAYEAGIKEGDLILSVDGKDVVSAGESFEAKTDVISKAIDEANESVAMTVLRKGETVDLTVSGIYDREKEKNVLGITMGYAQEFVPYGFFESFGQAGKFLVYVVTATAKAIANAFTNGFSEGDVSGIVGTVAITMKMASLGVYYVLLVMVLISMSLGLMNLLPILPLDGGHLLFDFIELIFGKPVPRKIQNVLSMIGIVLLLALMVYATVGDIKGIFNGTFS
ncbi:MAG: site-2 protease family protein [Clostridia bacterium]|nr:site-2 protease family protein [Clostridia bacterium]